MFLSEGLGVNYLLPFFIFYETPASILRYRNFLHYKEVSLDDLYSKSIYRNISHAKYTYNSSLLIQLREP